MVTTAATGVMETGVTGREALVAVIGALVAVADTEVEEDTLLATEKIGKHFHEAKNKTYLFFFFFLWQ